MSHGRWYYPVDPECPDVKDFNEGFWDDPMTVYSGCGGEIAQAFESKHRVKCKRCQEYGAANVDIL